MAEVPAKPKPAAPLPAKPVSVPPTAGQASRPSGGGGGGGGDAIMDKLLAESKVLTAPKCPQCQTSLVGGNVLCTRCGFNTMTGKAMKTRVLKPEKDKREKGAPREPALGKLNELSAWIVVPVVIALLGALGFVGGSMGPPVVLYALGALILANLVGWILGTVAAFNDDQALFGWCGILQLAPFIGVLASFGFLFYMIVLNPDKWSKGLYLGSLLGTLVLVAVAVTNNPGNGLSGALGF